MLCSGGAHKVDRSGVFQELGCIERVVLAPSGLQHLGVSEAVERPTHGGPDRVSMSWLHPGGGSKILAPTTRSPRVAGKNVDRITCSGAARPREESIDAQALESSRVEIAADDRCCHLLPVVTTAIHRL